MVLTVSAMGSCVTPYGWLPTGRSPWWAWLHPSLAWATSRCLFKVSLLQLHLLTAGSFMVANHGPDAVTGTTFCWYSKGSAQTRIPTS